MVNNVVKSFIEKMSLSDIATYRAQVGTTQDEKGNVTEGSRLDAVIAQVFIDFFHQVGKEHTEKFAKDRANLRDAFAHGTYGPDFTVYGKKITADVQERFPEFLAVYQRNLERELAGAPEAEAKVLRAQIASLNETSQQFLNPPITQPESFQARVAARQNDHRGKNMTEQWQFS